MLSQVIEHIHGIPTVRPDAIMFVRTLSVRPSARQLRDRRNRVYEAATADTSIQELGARMVHAHQAAEDYTIRVCEQVLAGRLAAAVIAREPAVPTSTPKRIRVRRTK